MVFYCTLNTTNTLISPRNFKTPKSEKISASLYSKIFLLGIIICDFKIEGLKDLIICY